MIRESEVLMNSTQLLYFVEAVKNNSMRKAAKVLNTTQPNVSSSIAALERETGVRLLVRTNKGIELTHEGQRFYSIALGVTDRMVVLKRMFHVTNESENFILNIASNPSLITTEVLAELQKNNPYERFIITVRNHSVMACANSVRAAESEIGIVFITSGYNTHYKK
ncbi:MAG: LysR family transcriptional regulator, partial [Clostridia bacterium]|nr:LysR family transcriptional regulator [Clostridia bacterium]